MPPFSKLSSYKDLHLRAVCRTVGSSYFIMSFITLGANLAKHWIV